MLESRSALPTEACRVSANISYRGSHTAGAASRSCRYNGQGSDSTASVYGSRSETGTAPEDATTVMPGTLGAGTRQIGAARRGVLSTRRELMANSAVNSPYIPDRETRTPQIRDQCRSCG